MTFLGDLRCLTANMKSRLTEDNKKMNKSVIICKGKIDEQAAVFFCANLSSRKEPLRFRVFGFLDFLKGSCHYCTIMCFTKGKFFVNSRGSGVQTEKFT